MKRILLFIFSLLLTFGSTQAVLNEADLLKTLEVLRDELTQAYKEQQVRLARYRQFDEMQHQRMLELIQKSNQTALVLYSQKQDYVFNLTYACNEATSQYQEFLKRQKPYFTILSKMESEIARYDKLIDALASLPPRVDVATFDTTTYVSVAATMANPLPEAKPHLIDISNIIPGDSADAEPPTAAAEEPDSAKLVNDSVNVAMLDSLLTNSSSLSKRSVFALSEEKQAERDSCIVIALKIRNAFIEICENSKQDYSLYTATADKLKKLNDYAQERYAEIQQNIFVNGESSFITMLMQPLYYFNLAVRDIHDKYVLTGEETTRSEWKGPVVVIFAFFALFYLAIVILICNVVIRFIVPKKYKSEKFEKRKIYYIMAASMILFSVVMLIMRAFINDNFFSMASFLLVEFTLLMAVIVASLLFRYDPDKLYNGFKIYLPIMVMGFVVILCRIIFIPNSVVSILFPPLLLVVTLWQYRSVVHNNKNVPRSDMFYTWISFASILVSCISSWCGFTLLAVQIFIWWMMQLTFIQGITCCYDAMKIYEDRILMKRFDATFGDNEEEKAKGMAAYHKRTGDYFKQTWIADLINMTVIPVIAVLSLPICIYYAADIFDMTEACTDIFLYDFINVPGVFELSLWKIVTVSGSYYVFRYINYIVKAAYRHAIMSRKDANRQANITLANNIISILCWGSFFVFALILLNVPSSGISIVTAGLATGIGFALKDILNNFFYGLSLMAGRVRVGELIECDGVRGKVESITYQSTQIQTLDGSIIAFLNSNLFAKSFKNMTRNHDYEFVKLPVGVAYGTDVNRVRQIIVERAKELTAPRPDGKYDIDPAKGVSVIFSDFGDSSVNLFVVFWVRIETKLKTCGAVNELVYNALNDNNIEIPFPQSDIHIKDVPAK